MKNDDVIIMFFRQPLKYKVVFLNSKNRVWSLKKGTCTMLSVTYPEQYIAQVTLTYGSVDVVEKLVMEGNPPDFQDAYTHWWPEKSTILHVLVWLVHISSNYPSDTKDAMSKIEMLVRQGANPAIRNANGHTPLEFAKWVRFPVPAALQELLCPY